MSFVLAVLKLLEWKDGRFFVIDILYQFFRAFFMPGSHDCISMGRNWIVS